MLKAQRTVRKLRPIWAPPWHESEAMDALGRLGSLFSSIAKGVSDVSSTILANKTADGTPKVLDQLPDVINTGLELVGAPPLPEANVMVAMGALEDLLVILSNENTDAKLKAAEGLASKLLPAVMSAAAEEISKKAGDNFVSDMALGMVKWVGENPTQALHLGIKIAATIGTAVATGGASLAKDIPLLIPDLVSAASGVMKAAGYTPQKLLTDIAVNFLTFMGVEEANAKKAAEIVVPLTMLGANIALTVATKGQHPIDPQLVQSAVTQIALATGVQPDTAAVIATGATMAFTLGQNFAGFVLAGNPPETFGGLDQIFTGVQSVAEEAVKVYMGQEGASVESIIAKLIELKPLFDSFAQTISENATASNPDYATKGWEAVNTQMVNFLPGLGVAFDSLSQVVDA